MTDAPSAAWELRRLASGGCGDAPPLPLAPFRVFVEAEGLAAVVLDRAREVLTRVLLTQQGGWPDDAEWARRLPAWFVAASAPERAAHEARTAFDRLDALPAERRDEETASWSVGSFVHWFGPRPRDWWWWGADLVDADRLIVCIATVEASPFHEALDWLLRAAGASEVIDEDLRALMIRDGKDHW